MTTIEKPGNDELFAEHTYKETYKPKRFKCDVCECEFTATKGDYKKKLFSSLFGLFDKYKVVCPHCGTKLVTEAIPDSHIDELLDELMEKLDNDVVEETEQEESTPEPIKQVQESGDNAVQAQTAIVYTPKSVTQVQKAGDNAVQVQVAKIGVSQKDSIVRDVMEEVKQKLGIDSISVAHDVTDGSIKALFQKGSKVATVSKELSTFIENGCSALPPEQVEKISSPVYADGHIVYNPQEPIDFDVVCKDPSWMHRDFGFANYGIELTFQELRKMHEQEEREKEKCR